MWQEACYNQESIEQYEQIYGSLVNVHWEGKLFSKETSGHLIENICYYPSVIETKRPAIYVPMYSLPSTSVTHRTFACFRADDTLPVILGKVLGTATVVAIVRILVDAK